MKTWSDLPSEILQIVLKNLVVTDSRKHFAQYELVCKNRKLPAQGILYPKAILKNQDKFDKFIRAVINNKQYKLEKYVKRIHLSFSPKTLFRNSTTTVMEILSTCLPYLEHITTADNFANDLYMTLMLLGLTDRKFQHLKVIHTAGYPREDQGLMLPCASIYKVSLTFLNLRGLPDTKGDVTLNFGE